MLDAGVVSGAEPTRRRALDRAVGPDRSMQVLEYVVAVIALMSALALALLR